MITLSPIKYPRTLLFFKTGYNVAKVGVGVDFTVNVLALAFFNKYPPTEKTKIFLLLFSVGWSIGNVLSLIISGVATLVFGSIRTSEPSHNPIRHFATQTGHIQIL